MSCAPHPLVAVRPCADAALAPDQVIVDEIVCAAERFDGDEEGRPSDYLMANSLLRAVLRHPESSPTLAGLGGATLIDLGTWDGEDLLHEAAPLINGSWLDVTEFELEDGSVRVGGFTRPLPDRPLTDEGSWAELRWSIRPNDPRIYIEGADALWLHPKGPAEIYDSTIQIGDALLAHDGVAVEDLGGGLRIEGASWLLVAEASTAWAWLDPQASRVSGTAPSATHLLLYEGEETIAKLPIAGGVFDLAIPQSTTTVRAVAEGFAPSAAVPPAEQLTLSLGGRGRVQLRPAWGATRPAPLWVDWTDAAGQDHSAWMGPEGIALDTGEGIFQLQIRGPDWIEPVALKLEIEAGETTAIEFAVIPVFIPPEARLITFETPADRSRIHRGDDDAELAKVSSTGASLTLVVAHDDVPETQLPPTLRPYLAHENASLATSAAGWEILSWPWSASFRRSAHGAVDTRFLDPQTALAAAWGGPGINRFTAANAAWFEAITEAVHTVDPRPDFVWLSSPGDQPSTSPGWSQWFEWLNQGVYLLPLGPQAWVQRPISPSTSAAELQDALIRGQFIATTGPIIELSLGDAKPGDILESEDPFPLETLRLRLAGIPDSIDQVAIIGDGRELVQWTIDKMPFEWSGLIKQRPSWLVAAAWSESEESWVATAPIWLDPPG
jgi:hypothetical protein